MQIEHLREFVEFSKYLNLTRAAETLHMSQSSLGKHLKGIEAELGFKLIDSSHKKLHLTKPGAVFLTEIQVELEAIDNTIAKCRQHANSEALEISVQDPPEFDESTNVFLKTINAMKTSYPMLSIKFIHFNFRFHRKMLQENKIDIVLEYRFGERSSIAEEYEQMELDFAFLAEVPLCLWCSKDNQIKKSSLKLTDLAHMQITTYQDASNPQQYLISDLYNAIGITSPALNIVDATSPAEFYHTSHPKSVFIIPAANKNNSFFAMREDMEYIFFEDNAVHADVYAVSLPGNSAFELFRKTLQRQG